MIRHALLTGLVRKIFSNSFTEFSKHSFVAVARISLIRCGGFDDGVASDIPAWALKLLSRDPLVVALQQQLDSSLMEDMDPIEEADGSDMPPLPAPRPCRFRVARDREYKYGFCQKHAKPLKPAVAYSGRHAGRVVCRCPHFYFPTENNGRECWVQNLYMGDPTCLPKGIVRKVKELKEDLRWNLRYGPASR